MAKPPEQLQEFLEKEKDRMYRIAWKMCGNPEDAEDVLQETALKALKSWDSFRGDSRISTWMYRIASNTCLSKQRKRNRETISPEEIEKLTAEDAFFQLQPNDDWSKDPLTQTLNSELRVTLDEAIARLPDIYRIVFVMRDIEGFSGEETAKALGISLSNVKVRLHRARMFLRQELEDYVLMRQEVTHA